MNTNDTRQLNDDGNEHERRTIRACVESMVVSRANDGEAGDVTVYNVRGEGYAVNVLHKTCSCPDEQRRHPAGGCKHLRRAEMEMGLREIPDLGRRTDVEAMVDARQRRAAARPARNTPTQAVATDGGVVVESGDESDDETDESEHECLCEIGDDLPCAACFIHHGVRGEVTEVRR